MARRPTRSEKLLEALNAPKTLVPAFTTADLIRELQRLDPEGTMQVALRGSSGAQVRPVNEIVTDTLHVSSQDPTFATRGIYHNGIMAKLCDVPKGECICLD